MGMFLLQLASGRGWSVSPLSRPLSASLLVSTLTYLVQCSLQESTVMSQDNPPQTRPGYQAGFYSSTDLSAQTSPGRWSQQGQSQTANLGCPRWVQGKLLWHQRGSVAGQEQKTEDSVTEESKALTGRGTRAKLTSTTLLSTPVVGNFLPVTSSSLMVSSTLLSPHPPVTSSLNGISSSLSKPSLSLSPCLSQGF